MKQLLTVLLCALISSPAEARRFDPHADPKIEAKRQSRQKKDGRLPVDSILLERANKVGKDGLISPARWAALNTRMGLFLRDGELNTVLRVQLDGVMKAPDRFNRVWETKSGVAGGMESGELGVRGVFSGGEFLQFTKEITYPVKGSGSPLADVLTHGKSPFGEGGDFTPQEIKAYDALILDSLRKSPRYRETPIKGADGKTELWAQAEDIGLAVHLRDGREPLDIHRLSKNGKPIDLKRAMETYLETNISKETLQSGKLGDMPPELAHKFNPGLLGRTADRIRQFGSRIKEFWVNLGESGHVRLGKGLTIQSATENLRYAEVPVKEVKAFRGSMSEAQLRSVAWMKWENAARVLRGRDADKFAAIDQAWVAASNESGMGLLVMEPKAGPALEFAMNRTAPKELLIKDKVNPLTRRVHVTEKNEHLIVPGERYTAALGDGYKYFFDTWAGKPVSSDFDLTAMGSRTELGDVRPPDHLGYASRLEGYSIETINRIFRSRGFKADPVRHGPQSNVQLPVNWSKDRMMGLIPGENRRYIIDSPKALADYLNLAAEKGLKFRIPDQWGAEPYLKASARANIEITAFKNLPGVGKD